MLASNNKRKKMNFTCLVNEKGRIEIVGGFVNRRKGGGVVLRGSCMMMAHTAETKRFEDWITIFFFLCRT